MGGASAAREGVGETLTPEAAPGLRSMIAAEERRFVLAALESTAWNVSRTARSLGMTRVGLYKAMQRLRIAR